MKKMNMKIVLASKSPGRKLLLEKAGFDVLVDVSNVDEDSVKRSNVKELVMQLARMKAEVVAERHKDEIVVAADTLVYFDGKEIGQQHSDEDAEKILRLLMGKTHEVYTGFCVINTKKKKILQDVVITEVTLKKVSDKVLSEYIKSGQYKRKAGAYNIADPEFESFIGHVEGSFTNTMGMPVEEIKQAIESVI